MYTQNQIRIINGIEFNNNKIASSICKPLIYYKCHISQQVGNLINSLRTTNILRGVGGGLKTLPHTLNRPQVNFNIKDKGKIIGKYYYNFNVETSFKA